MAVRISGINLPENKRIVIALTSIHGIGRSLSEQILGGLNLDVNTPVKDLTPGEEKKLRDYVEKEVRVEGDLRREVQQNIKHHRDIRSYRGDRHQRNLPARGQRTRTNSRTVRGNVRRTAGSGRRSAAAKT